MASSTYYVLTSHLKEIFYGYGNAIQTENWERIPYSEWKKLRKWLEHQEEEIITIKLFIQPKGMLMCGTDKDHYNFFSSAPNDFYHYLLSHLEEDERMVTSTTGTTTSNTYTYTTNTTAIPNYYNNYVTTTEYTLGSGNYSSGKISVGKVEIDKDGITINGKKVLTEENDSMDMKEFGFDFGPVNDGNIAVSPYGIAVKRVTGDGYCYYDPKKCEVIDCTPLTFYNKKLLYKMPVAISAIAEGDVIMHNGVPMFVKGIEDDQGRVVVIDISVSEEKYILPVKNIFGFNFITKIVSLFDMKNCGASADNPFGNMLPLMMLADDGKDLDPMMLLMMSGCGGSSNMFQMPQNPMMMYLLLSDQKNGKMKDMLPLFMLMGNQQHK